MKMTLKWRFQLATLVSHLINALTFSLKESFPRFVCLTVDISSVSYLAFLFSTISHGSLLFFRDLYFVPKKHQVFSTQKLISQTDLIHSVSFWNKGQSAKLSNSQALLSTLKGFYGEESETR